MNGGGGSGIIVFHIQGGGGCGRRFFAPICGVWWLFVAFCMFLGVVGVPRNWAGAWSVLKECRQDGCGTG